MRHAGEDWRYCFEFKSWLSWDKRRWLVDRTGQYRLAAKNAFLAELTHAIKTSDEKLEKAMRSALDRRRIDAALHLAEPELAITAAELDQDPNSLNCFNGTIDLQTSALRKHSRRDFNTKVVAYDYNPRAKCELWLTTLHRLMGGGADASEADLDRAERMVAYLQRIFGYALTGLTSEKAVFVPFGAGNNGKSTLLTLIPRLMDPTAGIIKMDGVDIRDYTLDSLRSQIAMVFQDSVLFGISLRENIAMGDPAATPEQVGDVASVDPDVHLGRWQSSVCEQIEHRQFQP